MGGIIVGPIVGPGVGDVVALVVGDGCCGSHSGHSYFPPSVSNGCCACQRSCCHIGPHNYCVKHSHLPREPWEVIC